MVEPVAPSPSVLPSHCPLDCPDACSLEIRVEDGRVAKVDGSRVNPVTEGYICSKVRRLPEHLYGPERLLYPGVRAGKKGDGTFERVSWDEALDLVAGRMAEVKARSGGEAILPFYYGGSNGLLTQDTVDARLFRRLGASRMARTVCAAATGRAATGLYGKMPGVAYEDYLHARLIVVWGANPAASGIHLVPIIQEAQRRGTKLVVIDPRKTLLAKKADLYLPIRPGSDLPVALSVMRWLFAEGRADREFLARHTTGSDELQRRAAAWTFERAAEKAGVPAAEIERFARLYADSAPAVIRCGWGLERNRNGGSAVASVLALPAVAGKFGVRGGGYTLSNSGAWAFDRTAVIGEDEPATRIVNMNRLGEVLLTAADPRIEVLFVYNCNALATLPAQEKVRRGLLREDLFTVVFDQVRTDTARYADVVLPATAFPEHEELSRGYGSYVLQHSKPVVPPAGETRGNCEVFAALCRRLGLARPGDLETAEEIAAAFLAQSPRMTSEIAERRWAAPDCGPRPVQFGKSFPLTPDQKAHLFPRELDEEAPFGLYSYQEDPVSEGFPLALISPSTNRTVSSTLGQLYRETVALEMNPTDAARRGIRSGDTVRVWNAEGDVRTVARLSADLSPGVVLLPKGLWSHQTHSGTTANALAPDSYTDLGQGACFNDARVEVQRD